MIFAIDKDLNRIHIDDAVIKQECYCPYCGKRLVQRRGNVRRHHFAHISKNSCTDSWSDSYDMSDWHYEWQNSFPRENQEVMVTLGDIKHRADVLICRTVVEFQHSNMSAKAFGDRNNFYFNLGYKVVWVFDFREQYESGRLYCDKDQRTFHWSRPRNTFNLYEIVTGQVELFFQLTDNRGGTLVKIKDISPFGFEEFTVSKWYTKTEFLEYLGVHNGICAAPERDDTGENEEYKDFCKKYGISLNRQQERAVQMVDGATLLLAVPGSGKTTVLVARLGYMILCKGINPQNILAITFGKQSKSDMKSRFNNVFGPQLGNSVEFRTIHGIAYQIIKHFEQISGRRAPQLLEDNKRLIAEILKEKEILGEYPSENEIIAAAAAITYIKNMSIAEETISEYPFDIPKMQIIYKKYQEKMNAAPRQMDYDDQILFAIQILKAMPKLLAEYRNRFTHICVDEAQDTSKSQHELIQLLVGERNNIFMVGDEDQSIYRFRGAYPQALIDFKDTYANPYILWMETNYRSTPEIVDIAAQFIAQNQNRYPKTMVASRPSGEPVCRIAVDSRKAQYMAIFDIAKTVPISTAVIYRDNDSAIPLIELLSRNNIPYRCPKKEFHFFTNRVVQDVVAFMKLQQNPKDVESFKRIYYKCGWYLDRKTVEFACNTVSWRNVTFVDALRNQAERYDKIESAVRNYTDFMYETVNLRARDFLEYLDGHGYGQYMQKNNLSRTGFEILLLLAYENPVVPEFMARLKQLQKLTSEKARDAKTGIILTTAHSSKGLEYDSVYLMDVYDGQFPATILKQEQGRKDHMDKEQEERRLFYVAMTRARNLLTVFKIKGRSSSFITEISPFFNEG